jgi:hypothetical protein
MGVSYAILSAATGYYAFIIQQKKYEMFAPISPTFTRFQFWFPLVVKKKKYNKQIKKGDKMVK